MRVLVACEYSGRVSGAFAAQGHYAVSCDLLDSEAAGAIHSRQFGDMPKHHKGDVRDILGDDWDLMIAHPPCTYLTNSGERWMKDNPERQELRRQAVEFARMLLDAPIPLIALENPVGHLSTAIRKSDQIIQPYQFGHLERKTTCLWLKGLPPLTPTDDKTAETLALPPSRRDKVHWMPPSEDRWKDRSRTYQGIANAMAAQWGVLELEPA